MGDGYSNPVVGAGGDLIRAAIRSLGYKLGLVGWTINQDGTAEFNNVTARGSITASELDVGPGNILIEDFLGVSQMRLYSHGSRETQAAIISNLEQFDEDTVELFALQSGATSDGLVILYLESPGANPALAPGKFMFFGGHNDGVTPSQVVLTDSNDYNAPIAPTVLRIHTNADASLSSTKHGFQIGRNDAANLIADNNEIMARDGAGGSATLNLQNDGGTVHMGAACTISGSMTAANMQAGTFTAAATPGGAAGTSATVVNFAAAFPSTPVRVMLTPRVSTAGAAALRMFGTSGIGTGGFTCNINRTDLLTTVFDYLAVCDMG